MMEARPVATSKPTVLGVIVSQLFVFLFCVFFPGLLTAIAPVSWVTFRRNDDHVAARAQVCLFFVVPYKTILVDPVESIGDRQVAGSESRRRRRGGPDQVTRSEDQGFLVIQGPERSAEVPVSPVDLKSVVERTDAFLKDPQAAELRLFVVANWKFGVIAGGLVSLATVLYAVGVTCWLCSRIYHGLRALQRSVPGADRATENF